MCNIIRMLPDRPQSSQFDNTQYCVDIEIIKWKQEVLRKSEIIKMETGRFEKKFYFCCEIKYCAIRKR